VCVYQMYTSDCVKPKRSQKIQNLNKMKKESKSGGDGTTGITSNDEIRFVKWLRDNGAKFPKIQWPARTTVDGVRGTIALEDIETGEIMLEIPQKLMMCEPVCKMSEKIGHVFRDTSLFRFGGVGSELVAVFLMHERLQGEKSFWYPFIKVLPDPTTICKWSRKQLNELQDPALCKAADDKWSHFRVQYIRLFSRLRSRFPDEFPEELYTESLFRWAILTVAARAFGRRLEWMALVPFADNLNHGNVATKYDFDVGGNGVFRLFPTGTNSYLKGREVFNSYGRRDNAHLLLHYGFAMLDNEHDHVPMFVEMFERAPSVDARLKLLRYVNIRKRELFKLDRKHFEWGVLVFHRVAVLSSRKARELSETIDDSIDRGNNFMRKPLSLEVEASALRSTMRYCRTFLVNHFDTTEKQDMKLLENKDLTMESRQAVVYRVTRKRIVRVYLETLQSMLNYVESLMEEEEEKKKNRKSLEHHKNALLDQTENLSYSSAFGDWIKDLSHTPRYLSSSK